MEFLCGTAIIVFDTLTKDIMESRSIIETIKENYFKENTKGEKRTRGIKDFSIPMCPGSFICAPGERTF